MNLITLLGWFGTCLYLVNHSYISLKPDWKHSIYYGGNFLAATSLVASSLAIFSMQAVIINGFWAIISFLLYFRISLAAIKIKSSWFYFCIVLFALYLLFNLIQTGNVNIAALGWLSAFLFSAGYLLFSIKVLPPRFYFIFNAIAALILLPQLWSDKNIPVLALEIVWTIISIYGAIQRYRGLRLID
jgi:hypothetical protein